MFKAVRDIAVGDLLIQAGEVVEKPSTRMIELGLVEEVQDEPKKAKVEKKEKAEKSTKVEEKTEEVQTPKEELLTEQSSDVTVEKTEE